MFGMLRKVGLGAALALGIGAASSDVAHAQYPGRTSGFGIQVGNLAISGFNGYGRPQVWNNYYRGGYGGGYGGGHYDYHPGGYQRHYNHYHYVPGHYDYHQGGHGHYGGYGRY